ncbi:MAG: transglutaminase domain-containing protein, partial [Clostridiales bacterium]|nr:transglutaminase domain-containing protein [Clostridiales bacterium]
LVSIIPSVIVIGLCWETAPAFLDWCRAGFIPFNADFYRSYYLLFHMLPALSITICLWLLIRRRAPFPLLFIGAMVALIAFSAYGIRGQSASIYLLAAGLLPLAAGSSVACATAARTRAVAVALPLATIILAAVFLVLPSDTTTLRWYPLSYKIYEIQLKAYNTYMAWQQRDAIFDYFDTMEEYHSLLGGPIAPDNTRMLLVETDTPQLLKASVYDYYTGYSWEKSDSYRPQYFSGAISRDTVSFVSGENNNVLNLAPNFVPDPDSWHPLAPFTQQIKANVTMYHSQGPRLFYSGQLMEFYSLYEIDPVVEENSELKSSLELGNGYSYEFTGLVLDRTKSGFADALATLPEFLSPDELDSSKLDIMDYRYGVQIPLGFMLDEDYFAIVQTVQDIVDEGLLPDETRSKYEKAVLLEKWLKENCSYTLTPQEPPPNKDFVLHFLDTREGYCAYYASAMVMMSRMIGIPARYITGYALEPTRYENQYEATQATAHAWAELFFDGAGWLPFDATGQADYSETSAVQFISIFDREFWGGSASSTIVEKSYVSVWTFLWIILALVVLATILLFRHARLAYRLSKLLPRFSHAAILNIYYRNLLVQLKLLGWQRLPAETILDFMRRMGVYLPRQAKQLCSLGIAVSALRYGNITPEQEDLQNAVLLHDHFDNMLRRQLKTGKYCSYRLRYSFVQG